MRPFYPRSRALPATDGIVARSRRGAIGETWWSQRFIAVLESFRMGARMGRGRTYARKGQVMDLRVSPGRVTARVQGSRRGAYRVSLDIPALDAAHWDVVERALSGQAVFLARLLAGEMPADIEELLAEEGVPLFPASRAQLTTSCSCPDWANPCKHIAATLYILAERFDEDPFLIFAWRGRDRSELLQRLRARKPAPGAEAELASHAPLPQDLRGFFELRGELPPVRPPQGQQSSAPGWLLGELGASGLSLQGRDLARHLDVAYEELVSGVGERGRQG